MQLRTLTLLAGSALSAFLASPASSAEVPVPKYYCETDADCEANFPGTVCISVDNYGEITKKCTPNTKERPACRGAQPGLCPSYQSEEVGYLNVHCVFVAKDKESAAVPSTSGSGSGSSSAAAANATAKPKAKKNATAKAPSRWLMLEASNATLLTPNATAAPASKKPAAAASSTAGSGAGTVSAPVDETPAPAEVVGGYAKVRILNQTITGQFMCVDVSDCENRAFDTSTCAPAACGSPNSKMQCNNHGTCTYPSVQTMSKRKCMCYAGFGGDKCQQEISAECDVDCGMGGDCVNGQCKCKKGFDGASYKGKKGKPSQRCTKCTNDQACQNGNPCDTETGVCVCQAGFKGPTCGATEDSCTTKSCGIGSCKVNGNGTSVCLCPICAPDCEICKTKDCSTCPSAASAISMSKLVIFASFAAAIAAHLIM